MKFRSLAIAAVTVAAIAASQFGTNGSAYAAIGSANGGVWKTTDGAGPSAVHLPAIQEFTGPSDEQSMLLPAVQKAREAAAR